MYPCKRMLLSSKDEHATLKKIITYFKHYAKAKKLEVKVPVMDDSIYIYFRKENHPKVTVSSVRRIAKRYKETLSDVNILYLACNSEFCKCIRMSKCIKLHALRISFLPPYGT